jgi:nicotinate-nucleotide adenylyltransferase
MSADAAPASAGARRVAFFGGSFDPPHLGHVAVARAARDALRLDTVLFAPVGTQPLKPQGSTASFEDRVALTELAIAGEPGFAVSLADAPRESGHPNFTIDTLLQLRQQLPPHSSLFCLMGADSFFGLGDWYRAAEIPFVAPLIVASRPDQWAELRFEALRAALPTGLSIDAAPGGDSSVSGIEVEGFVLRNSAGECAPLFLLPGLDVEISASQIRALIHEYTGGSAASQQLLRAEVFEAIRARGLYR